MCSVPEMCSTHAKISKHLKKKTKQEEAEAEVM